MTTMAPLQPIPAHQQATIDTVDTPNHGHASQKPDSVPRGDVTATLNFYNPPPDGSRPFAYVESPPPNQPQRNYSDTPHAVTIHDLRGLESTVNTDTHAFAADAHIRAAYYREVDRLLLARLPGTPHRVLVFDHTIRRATAAAARAPVTRVHVDQTAASGLERVHLHVADPGEAAALARGRVRIVNVWRPIGAQPVAALPLAVADGRSVREGDLVAVEHRYPERTGETAGVRWGEGQEWWYWSGMTSEERLLLKCFDSDAEVGSVGRAPHSAFVDPRTTRDAPPRESIEVRCLVFG